MPVLGLMTKRVPSYAVIAYVSVASDAGVGRSGSAAVGAKSHLSCEPGATFSLMEKLYDARVKNGASFTSLTVTVTVEVAESGGVPLSVTRTYSV